MCISHTQTLSHTPLPTHTHTHTLTLFSISRQCLHHLADGVACKENMIFYFYLFYFISISRQRLRHLANEVFCTENMIVCV